VTTVVSRGELIPATGSESEPTQAVEVEVK